MSAIASTLALPLDRPDRTTTTARSRRADVALVLGVPLLWAVVLLFHPTGDPEKALEVIRADHGAWMFVHVTMVAFIPLMAVAVHRLVRGVDSTPARISRWAMPLFVAAYGAFEALMGLATGILAGTADGADDPARAEMVQDLMHSRVLANLERVGSLAWGVVLVAAAFALRRAHRIGPWSVTGFVVAAPLIAVHAPPFGPVGLAVFVAAALPALRHDRT